MQETVVERADPPFRWIDVIGPSREELAALARGLAFHPMAVEDCLDPWHLPKYERFGDTTFVILRAFDHEAPAEGSNVQALTRKIAIFYRAGLLVTIHRVALPVIATVVHKVRAAAASGAPPSEASVLGALMNEVLDSYEAPLDAADDTVDELEAALLTEGRQDPSLEAIHRLKHRVNLIKRLLWQTLSVSQKLVPAHDRQEPVFHDFRENVESYYFYADQVAEELNNLLNMHVALSSRRSNEVMRVLTIFAAFFLPLTFIVGVYGMNFDYMPELRERLGYPAVMGFMAAVALVIGWWFRRRGWLGGRGS